MPFPYDTDDQDAIDRLAAVSNATFANGAHVTNFPPRLNDTATLANAVADAATAADAAADQTALDVIAAAASAAKLSGTSTTSNSIGTGTKTFTTQADKFFDEQDMKAYSAADPTKWMLGLGEYNGTTLVMDVTHTNGSGTEITDWVFVVTGRVGSAGTIEIGAVAALAPGASPTVENVGSNDAAELEFGIPVGAPAGLAFNWSTNTDANTDPTAGKVKAGSASLEAALFLYVSETDADGRAVAADIGTWDESDSAIRGKIFIKDPVTPANFVEYNITGAIIDSGAWRKIPVVHVAHGGTLTEALRLYIQNTVNGEMGDPGTAGVAATVAVGAVTTGAAGSAAAVDNSGTSGAAIFDFTIPRGATGATGPAVGVKFNYDDSTTDGDPGAGNFRLNDTAFAVATQGFFDNAEAGGAAITTWLDSLDDSTNTTSKGTLFAVKINDPTTFAIYSVTGSVTDGTGYRKVTLAHISSNGTPTDGDAFAFVFSRAGHKGSDGLGAGDVVGPASSGDGNLALFDGTDGKLIKDGGVLTAFAKTFLDDANAGAVQVTLGLVPGTNVQAFHAIISALAGLSNVSGLIEQTGASSFTQRLLGVGASTSVPTRADADARYLGLAGGTLTGALTLNADGSSSLHAITYQQFQSGLLGVGKRRSVRAATTANITIATALNNGDTLDTSVTLATGDLVLVKNQTAPEENGVYVVGTSPARSSEFDTYNEHPGAVIAIEEGTANADTLWWFTSNQGGTLNTTALTVSQLFFTAYTAHASLVLTGNQFSLNINNPNTWTATQTFTSPVINSLPTGTGVASAATASTLAARDANGNLLAANHLEGFATIATAAGTTTLTVASTWLQQFTGSTTQTIVLPVASTLALGHSFRIGNLSTGILTVNSSGANLVASVAPGGTVDITCILASGTDAASWSAIYRAYVGIPQDSVSTTLTFALSDNGRHKLHPSADTTARSWTIPAYSAGTTTDLPTDWVCTVINQASGGVITIVAPGGTEVMRLAGAGTTGNRTLAANGIAVIKRLATGSTGEYIISGTGLT